jgi:hypothetical protein
VFKLLAHRARDVDNSAARRLDLPADRSSGAGNVPRRGALHGAERAAAGDLAAVDALTREDAVHVVEPPRMPEPATVAAICRC